MFSADNLQLFSKWYSIMPNKISEKFKNIYISNLQNLHEFQEISKIFANTNLILNNLLFDVSHISKSTYMFDLIIYVDICDLFSVSILNEFKQNILQEKGEIWILCDNNRIYDKKKIDYINSIVDNSNFRQSIIKFTDNFSLIVLK
tara:strand:- start:2293 stop:2730 length:438 start_codon:yes stop_codon:yes gene_type:complete